jgi:hypothetical protein
MELDYVTLYERAKLFLHERPAHLICDCSSCCHAIKVLIDQEIDAAYERGRYDEAIERDDAQA